MFSLFRPFIFKLDPELAHNLAIKALKTNILPSTQKNIFENLSNIIEHIRRKNYSKIYTFGMKIPFTPVILLSWGWLGIEIYGKN